MEIVVAGLAAGAITVLICTSKAFENVRELAYIPHEWLGDLFNCHFCTSWWVSLACYHQFDLGWPATVAIANIVILGIHMGIATISADAT